MRNGKLLLISRCVLPGFEWFGSPETITTGLPAGQLRQHDNIGTPSGAGGFCCGAAAATAATAATELFVTLTMRSELFAGQRANVEVYAKWLDAICDSGCAPRGARILSLREKCPTLSRKSILRDGRIHF